MAGRARRGKGRLMESWGALTDNKKLKDKGRALQGEGAARSAAGRVKGLFDRARGK
jgi:uncharacterized protein YjbJ (UPF0337 family)